MKESLSSPRLFRSPWIFSDTTPEPGMWGVLKDWLPCGSETVSVKFSYFLRWHSTVLAGSRMYVPATSDSVASHSDYLYRYSRYQCFVIRHKKKKSGFLPSLPTSCRAFKHSKTVTCTRFLQENPTNSDQGTISHQMLFFPTHTYAVTWAQRSHCLVKRETHGQWNKIKFNARQNPKMSLWSPPPTGQAPSPHDSITLHPRNFHEELCRCHYCPKSADLNIENFGGSYLIRRVSGWA